MSKPILDPAYWRGRLEEARQGDNLHRAIYHCHRGLWDQIEAKHREIIAKLIGNHDSVLDVGCGYGRLLSLMPPTWDGYYVGIDISPDFIALARMRWFDKYFMCSDIRDVMVPWRFDWAVMVSFRPMVKDNLGGEVWSEMEAVIRKSATRLLFLEYTPSDEGSVE